MLIVFTVEEECVLNVKNLLRLIIMYRVAKNMKENHQTVKSLMKSDQSASQPINTLAKLYTTNLIIRPQFRIFFQTQLKKYYVSFRGNLKVYSAKELLQGKPRGQYFISVSLLMLLRLRANSIHGQCFHYRVSLPDWQTGSLCEYS